MTQTIINVPAAGAFDPTDITLTDNTSGALLIKEGSNEYMRIDTTNGSELVRISTPGSGASTGLFFNIPAVGDAFYIQRTGSSPATRIVTNAGTTQFQVDSSQILADLIASNKTFKVDGTPGTTPLTIDGDGETTFTLDETNAARFRIMDNGAATGVGSAGPITFLDIQSSNNNTATGDYIKLSLEPEATDRYFELKSNSAKLYCQNARLDMTTSAATFTLYDDFQIGQFQSGKRILVCKDAQNSHEALTVDKTADSTFNIFAPSSGVIHAPVAGSSFKVRRRESGGTVDCLTIAPDSETTIELDGGSANYFTVKNDVIANHIFRVNSQTRHTEIERIGYGGTQYFGYAADYCQRSQPACLDGATHVTSATTLAVPDMGGSPGSGTFNNINRRTAIRIHSASQSASGDLFTATLNVVDNYDQLIREMFLYVSNYDSTNNFALKIQASTGGNWRELNSSGITGVSGQTIDAASTYVYRIFQYAPGNTAATRVYGIYFMGKMAH